MFTVTVVGMRAQPKPISPSCLRKELNVFDAVSIVVGTIIGSGIFLIPSNVAAQLDSLGAVMLVWVIGGVLTLFGALSLAEVGSIIPATGGLCTYLQDVYGPLFGFLYAWALLAMIHSGSIAALAVAFGLFSDQLFGLGATGMKAISGAVVLALTAINCLGIRSGKIVQNIVTVMKLSALAGMVVLLIVAGAHPIRLSAIGKDPPSSFTGFGIALIAVLWGYEGWHVISFVAGEMKRPRIDLQRSLLFGTAIVMLIFLMANIGYYRTLSPMEIRTSNAVAAEGVRRVLGARGSEALSLLVLISILGSMNGMILTGPRVYYAMAHDGIFPRLFSRTSRSYQTPAIGLIVQGIWAAVLAISGSYQELFTDVIFTAWIFYALGVAAVLVLRQTRPYVERSFSVIGYPWVPLVFCAAALGLIVSTIIERPRDAWAGLGLVAIGIPFYFCLRVGKQQRHV